MASISKAKLYDALINNKRVQQRQAKALVDLGALGTGIGSVEAARTPLGYLVIESAGDVVNGVATAHGIFQVNDRVHKVEHASIPLLSYQIEELYLVVYLECDAFVRKSLTAIRERKDRGEEIDFRPARDIPHMFNVAWQYGIGGLYNWAKGGSSMTVEGFELFRASIGKPVESGYRARAKSFAATYAEYIADPPDFWRDVVGQSVAHPIESLKETGKLAAENLPELPDLPKVPNPFEALIGAVWSVGKTALIIIAGISVLVVLLVVWFVHSTRADLRSLRALDVSTPAGVRVRAKRGGSS